MRGDAPGSWESSAPPGEGQVVPFLRAVMEAVVLAMVALSPWAFGAVDPQYEFLLVAGVGVLVILWALRIVVEGRLSWRKCPVSVILAGLIVLGFWQLAPWSSRALARLSPGTARLYAELLPQAHEVLQSGTPPEPILPPAGSTISVSPAATRTELFRLFAVLCLFAAVRNHVASPDSLRRLGLLVLSNGTLLALFALVQAASSAHSMVYWTVPTPGGSVFGPFVNHSHYATYINLCLGPGLGVLLRRRGRTDGPSRHLDAGVLAMQLALVVLASSVFLSLSRGGTLAFCGGVLACLAVRLAGRRRFPGLATSLVVLAGILALVGWAGRDDVRNRLATLGQLRTYEQDRARIWSGAWSFIGRSFAWGTGYGTYREVEPLSRAEGLDPQLVVAHAHNEYLESLVEGGTIRLVLVVLAVVVVGHRAIRATRLHHGRSAGRLALGVLFSVATLAIHSVCEFAVHVPAVTVLAAVIAAQACGLAEGQGGAPGRGRRRLRRSHAGRSADPGELVIAVPGVARIVGLFALVPAMLFFVEGWRLRQVQVLRAAAVAGAETGIAGVVEASRRLAILEPAGRLAPESGRLQAELGSAHLDVFEARRELLRRRVGQVERVRGTLAPWGLVVRIHPAWAVAGEAPAWCLRLGELSLAEEDLIPALVHYVRARDLCPLLVEPQLAIAAHTSAFERADPPMAYMKRVRRLAPTDPRTWYYFGAMQVAEGDTAGADRSWRRSLELSGRFLPEIMARSAPRLGPGEILGRIVPDQPALIAAAAWILFPKPEASAARRPFLEKAVGLHELAMAAHPTDVPSRYELARVLNDLDRAADARRELLTVLALDPRHGPAWALLDAVEARIARGD